MKQKIVNTFYISIGLFLFCGLHPTTTFGAYCQGGSRAILDDGKKVHFCPAEHWLVTENCFLHQDKCKLLSDLRERLPAIQKATHPYSSGINPGAFFCSKLGWKVSRGKGLMGGEACLCQAPDDEMVVCTSLLYKGTK